MSESTATESKELKPQANYAVLKEQLLLVAAELHSCPDVINHINDITDKASFKRAYIRTHEMIGSHWGLENDTSDLDDEIDDLKDEIDDLKDEVSSLEDELDEFKDKFGEIGSGTLDDNYKVDYFLEYKNKYTAWELEELLKNGHELLKLQTVK